MQKLYNEVQNDVCKMNERACILRKMNSPSTSSLTMTRFSSPVSGGHYKKSERDERMVLGEELVQAQIGGDQR